MVILIGLLAIAFIIIVTACNWQRSVIAALIIVIFEGALRKWALPQASQLIYFLKDIVLLGTYIGFLFSSRNSWKIFQKNRSILVLVVFSFIWCAVQAFNPSLGSPIIGVFGLKNYFFYIPLIWLFPLIFRTENELYTFLRNYLLILIPVALLAIVQFYSPPSSPLNVYAWGDAGPDVAVAGLGTVRVTGTFSYITGYTTYLSVCLCLLLPMLSLRQSWLWQLITIFEFVLIVVTAFMTGSRGIMLTSILLLSSYFCVQSIEDPRTLYRAVKRFFIPALVAFVVAVRAFQTAIQSFWLRVTRNEDVPGRISSNFTEPFVNFQLKEFDGFGLGATFQANEFLRQTFNLPPGETIPVYYEAELGRIALEIGPIGFFLWYGLKLAMLIALWRVYLTLSRPFLRHLALSAFLLQVITTFNSQLVYNHTANLFHWFLFSFIFLLPQLQTMAHWGDYQQVLHANGYSSYILDPSHE